MKKTTFISVILPLKLEWEPCYCLPEGVQVTVGDRVKVTFAGRAYTGVVSETETIPQTEPEKIKEIVSVEKQLERVGEQEIRLWREIAGYYMCSIGEVYKAAYPLGRTEMEVANAEARQKADEREKVRKEKALLRLLYRKNKLEMRLHKKKELAEKARKDSTRNAYIADAEAAALEIASLVSEIQELEGPSFKINDSVHGIEQNKLQEQQDHPITLSPAQQTAIDQITVAFETDKPVLLNGVTGSGKTEVYMKLTQDTIRQNRNVLYLVPEIALSRQLEDRLHEVFGQKLMVFHSGETSARRRNTADHIRNTDGYIILGTRSSIFLPHHDLGLIIVDEEHDTSYKQDSPAPRYNGRDAALMLNNLHDGCNIVLGTATPSLEEQYNCQVGKHVMVKLKEKYYGSAESKTEIIDTRVERRKNGMVGNFSRRLIRHIENTLEEEGQVLILRARKAWSSAIQCEQCGDIPKCPHCNVSLSLHNDGSMRCHYCGFRRQKTDRCTICGGNMKPLGAGTQKIEEEAATLFPNAVTARLDSDTSQNESKRIIQEFAEGKIDIIIGTQMITKGFDFSKLTLVAVVAADSLLGTQDFRADERAYQLLEQLRGRSGRRAQKGLFVIQTAQPEHPIYQNLTSEVQDFGTSLLTERKEFNFPPYTRIVEISIRDRFKDRAEKMSHALASSIRLYMPSPEGTLNDPVIGPYAPAVDRIADQHIRNIRLSLKKNRQLSSEKAALKTIICQFEKEMRYDGHITINVDPT